LHYQFTPAHIYISKEGVGLTNLACQVDPE